MKIRSVVAALATAAAVSAPLYGQAESAEDYLHMNKTVETLAADKPVFGVFTGNFSLANARALARSGLDYLFIDMEHTPMNMETLQTFLLGMTDKAAVAKNGHAQMAVTPLVRIPMNGRENLQWQVKQVLDAGAYGVVFPYVETREQAENAIRAMRYPQARGDKAMEPAGLRGLSPGIPSWFWGVRDYVQRADVWPLDPKGDLLAVIQIESKEGVDNIEEIASVPGIGAIFIGPADLSMSLGVPFQTNHPDMKAAMDKVLNVCKKRDIPCGLTTNSRTVEDYLDQGYSFVTVGYWNDAGISDEPSRALGIARKAAGRD
ncbi:HpcH/HpaI aldolase family protein [Gilvimarinus sp. F26214L]|uniref:HpcH/HpaI aldolase family protein n=1 Tax=Gilvimarinus sp. DZF01 TaxID=3461371 RepID=UPI0040458A0C